jgi:hypothetical protein
MKRIGFLLFTSVVMVILTACKDQVTTPDLQFSPTATAVTATASPTFRKQTPTAVTITPTGRIRMPTITPTTTITLKPDYPKLVPEEYSHYIGLIVPPYPEEVLHGGGRVMGVFSSTGYDNPKFGIGHVRMNDLYTLWFEMFRYRDSKGKAYWEVLDILILPELRKDEVYIHDGCLLNGEYDGEILVIALLDRNAFYKRYVTNEKVRMAWRANRAKQAYEVISTEGIECYADMAFRDK